MEAPTAADGRATDFRDARGEGAAFGQIFYGGPELGDVVFDSVRIAFSVSGVEVGFL